MTESSPKKPKGLLGLLIRILGAGIVLTILFSIVDEKKLINTLAQTETRWLLLAIGLAVASPLLTSARLKLFLASSGTMVSYHRCLGAALCGLSLNLVLPARGGDLAKIAFLHKDRKPSWGTLTGVAILERGFDVLALAIIGLAASLALGLKQATVVAGIIALATTAGLLLLPKLASLPIVGKKAKTIVTVTSKVRQRPAILLLAIGTAFLCWTTNSLIMGCLLRSFDKTLSFVQAFSATPPAILAGIVPISLWGIGTRDGTLALFLHDATAAENALAAGFLYTALVYWMLGLIGLPALGIARRTVTVDKTNVAEGT